MKNVFRYGSITNWVRGEWMGDLSPFITVAGAIAHELVFFAAILFLLGGIDDLLIDLIWISNAIWRRFVVFRKRPRADLTRWTPPRRPGWLAVFVPAWQEDGVIGPMLRNALERFDHEDYRLYVGVYPNDPATIDAVAAIAENDARVRLVINPQPGPTTKADCLNVLWRALLRDEMARCMRAKAIILHDAEDVVHSGELRIFDTLIERFDLVQLPVLPLSDPTSRWVSGHYLDEFAESHGKSVIARETLGAAVPSAGVGCAFSRGMLWRIAAEKGGMPFDSDSLTEDYELGLRIKALGGRGIFVRLPTAPGAPPVAVRAHFPARFTDAVHQKSRWITGIALAGWDRMGWEGGFAEFWMRLRDRRVLLSAIALLAAYAGLILSAICWLWFAFTGHNAMPLTPLRGLLGANASLLLWRLGMRSYFVYRAYGWDEAWRSIPRMVVANIIAMAAARKALVRYFILRRGGTLEWGKTSHIFPTTTPTE